MRPSSWFAQHPVFRVEEFVAAHAGEAGRSRQTSAAVLKQHVAAGNLVRVRRGLYATVPRGADGETAPIDPYLVAAHLHDDAAITYHTALQYHGRAYTSWSTFQVVSRVRAPTFDFRGARYVTVQAPASVRQDPDLGGGIALESHAGGQVLVTTLERTLVDVLDRPDLGGGWEEIWRSLEAVEFFDLDAVLTYVRRLGSALTAARVGLFLEQHREPLIVDDEHLNTLTRLAPRQPRYLDTSRERGRLLPRWNLIVSERLLRRDWEEPA